MRLGVSGNALHLKGWARLVPSLIPGDRQSVDRLYLPPAPGQTQIRKDVSHNEEDT